MNPRINLFAALLPTLFTLSANAEQSAQLESVLVTATRTETRINSILSDITVVSREEIQSAPQTSLPELLATLPGIQVANAGGRGSSNSLFIRGTNSEHAVVLVDGQRVSSATLGTTSLEHIPLELIDHIEVVRGPASSLYGADAIGGVIQVFTKRGEGAPAPSLSLAYGRYNTTIGSAGYGGKIGDTRFDIRAGWEDSQGFSTYRNAVGGMYDPYNPDKDAYQNTNLSANVSHRISNTLELGAQVLKISAEKHFDQANCDSFYSSCTATYNNRLRQDLDSYSGFVRVKPADFWSSQLKIGQSRDRQRSWRLDPSTSSEFVDRFTTTQDQASWQNDFSFGQAGKLLAAYDWRNERVDSTQTFTAHSRATNALVLGYQGWFGAHSLQTSARRDDIEGFDPHTSSSLAYGYEIVDGLRARASVGRAFHVPTFNQLYWPADPIFYFKGNPNLRVERAYNREAGLSFERGNTQAGMSVFYNKVNDLINFASVPFPGLSSYENVGRATLKGISLTYAQTLGSWRLRSGFDYLDARDDNTGKALQKRVPRTANVDLSYRQASWEAGVQILGYSGHFNDNANSQWLGGYALTNLYATYRLQGNWSVFARGNNVLDRKYVAVRDPNNGNDYSVPGASLFVGIRYEPK